MNEEGCREWQPFFCVSQYQKRVNLQLLINLSFKKEQLSLNCKAVPERGKFLT